MNETEAIKSIEKLIDEDDVEIAHTEADNILCEVLEHLGYTKLVKTWKKVPKHYS